MHITIQNNSWKCDPKSAFGKTKFFIKISHRIDIIESEKVETWETKSELYVFYALYVIELK